MKSTMLKRLAAVCCTTKTPNPICGEAMNPCREDDDFMRDTVVRRECARTDVDKAGCEAKGGKVQSHEPFDLAPAGVKSISPAHLHVRPMWARSTCR